MKKRLFLYITVIVVVGFLCFFGLSVNITQTNNVSLAKQTVVETARIYAGLFNDSIDLASFVKNDGDIRVTVISQDGIVLADSRPVNVDAMENHLNRPEIITAASGAPEPFVRYSETLGIDLIYYALKVDSGDGYVFIRTAFPVAQIDIYLLKYLPLLVFSLAAVILLCFLFILGMTNKVLSPLYSIGQKLRLLSKGNYIMEPIESSYEEIDQITGEIDEIAIILQNSLEELRDEKTKLDYVLGNIGDGLFVVDKDKEIVLINSVAQGIFNVNSEIIGKNLNYLASEKAIVEKVKDCANHGEDNLFEFEKNGRIFLTTIKRIPSTKLTMAVLSDVTENRENSKQREEFFANASHELKTPLSAIKGFNELTAINNKDADINKYIDSISRETDRMLLLIEDMLKLSELENSGNINSVSVSLAGIVDEVKEALSTSISEKSIDFKVVGDSSVIADPEHIYELIKNIVENAVRYNNNGGTVSVKIEKDRDISKLIVVDDGIGIPPEEQTRIFERFYRVEKSRSVRNGGTGLGLSIVKHICSLYGWKLYLKSKAGVGTEVVVEFGVK